jgi:hypothetical protein
MCVAVSNSPCSECVSPKIGQFVCFTKDRRVCVESFTRVHASQKQLRHLLCWTSARNSGTCMASCTGGQLCGRSLSHARHHCLVQQRCSAFNTRAVLTCADPYVAPYTCTAYTWCQDPIAVQRNWSKHWVNTARTLNMNRHHAPDASETSTWRRWPLWPQHLD